MPDKTPQLKDSPARRVHRPDLRRLFTLAGAVGLSVFFTGPALAASAYVLPSITVTQSTFKVPAQSTSTWRLRLWSEGILEGSATGTSGTLVVAVPHTANSAFQADVSATPLGGRQFFYSGARATLSRCGVTPPRQTIAGHIYLCSAAGAPTTTEVPGGTLAATGPQTVAPQPNPLAPTAVASGSYTMTASPAAGDILMACGGSATVASGGLMASETVLLLPGDAGVGRFYTSAPPSSAGGGSTGPTSDAGATSPSHGSTGGTAGTPTAARSAPVATIAAGSSHLAFTGLDAGPPLVLGLVLLALGSAMVAWAGPRTSARRPAHVRTRTSSGRHVD